MTEITMWNWGSLLAAMPELFLALSGLVLLVMGVFLKREGSVIMSWAVLSMFAVTMFLLLHMDWSRVTAFSGHFVMDRYSGYMKLLVLTGLVLLIWLPTLRVPAMLALTAGAIAEASLYTYLTHFQVYPLFGTHKLYGVIASIVIGIALTAVVTLVRQRMRDRRFTPRDPARAPVLR